MIEINNLKNNCHALPWYHIVRLWWKTKCFSPFVGKGYRNLSEGCRYSIPFLNNFGKPPRSPCFWLLNYLSRHQITVPTTQPPLSPLRTNTSFWTSFSEKRPRSVSGGGGSLGPETERKFGGKKLQWRKRWNLYKAMINIDKPCRPKGKLATTNSKGIAWNFGQQYVILVTCEALHCTAFNQVIIIVCVWFCGFLFQNGASMGPTSNWIQIRHGFCLTTRKPARQRMARVKQVWIRIGFFLGL